MSDKKSFIENVNIVANSMQASSGDIVEDAENAKNAAEAAAKEAKQSASNALTSEEMSKEWAERAYNNPIPGYPNHFSSFHWSEIAKQNAGSAVIFDNTISEHQTWSSNKISDQLNLKSNATHNHDLDYELRFAKNSAFNKNFGGTGSSQDVARADHDHTGIYEPKLQSYGTAFNKNFGTGSGDVAEGSHNHDARYMPRETRNTAYNKNFGTTIGTVAVGNHTHEAVNIGYDNTRSKIITSAQAQGAIDQLDEFMGAITTSENTYMTAGYSSTVEIPIAGQDTPVPITVPVAVLASKNASLTNGSSIYVKYPTDSTPIKKIEGIITVTVSTTNTDNLRMSIAVDGTEQGEGVKGKDTLAISKYLTGLNEIGFTITPMISNLDNTNNVFITSISITWEGAPQGALVISGISIKHNDTSDRTDPNAHPISSITGLEAELNTKVNKPSTIVDGNVPLIDANGNLKDSGLSTSDINGSMPRISPAVLDNIAVQQTDGTLKDGGKKITDLALKNGSTAEVFNVGIATADTHAVRKKTLDDGLAAKANASDLNAHKADNANPHKVTAAQVGAAPVSHTHSQSDITGLTDAINSKYDKLLTAAQDNIVLFGTSGILKDSGVSLSSLMAGNDTGAIGNINNPLLDMPLNNSLGVKQGINQVTFTRPTTATYIDIYGVLRTAIAHEPRFEKDGLLMEPSSTNLQTYSKGGAYWTHARDPENLSLNTELAPSLEYEATKFDATTNFDHVVSGPPVQLVNGKTYTISVWVKADVDAELVLSVADRIDWTIQPIRIEFALSNEWKRYEVTGDWSTDNEGVVLINISGTSTPGTVYYWGAQVEMLGFSTSYIPTDSSAVTRVGDMCKVALYGNSPGYTRNSDMTMMFDIAPKDTRLGSHYTSHYNAVTGFTALRCYAVDQNTVRWQYAPDGDTGSGQTNYITGDKARIAKVVKNNIPTSYNDGKLIHTDLAANYTKNYIPETTDFVYLGHYTNPQSTAFGHIKNFRIWDIALTEEEVRLA